MYAKIFDSIFDGTLRDKWQALVTFMALLVLADEHDEVDMTIAAIVSRTGLPGGVITEGISALEAPDEFSRSPEEGGRRIVRLDPHRPWGWKIVNRAKYRAIRDRSERSQYFKDRRESLKNGTAPTPHPLSPTPHPLAPHTDTDTDAQTTDKTLLSVPDVKVIPSRRSKASPRGKALDPAWEESFGRFWEVYPRRDKKKDANKAWHKLPSQTPADAERIVAAATLYAALPFEDSRFIALPASWINAERWNDESLTAPHKPAAPVQGGIDWSRA